MTHTPGVVPLSVVLATIEPWPDLARCLAVLEPQVTALGGEIIVGDGHGAALDATHVANSRCISWVRIPGASVFELRARAVEQARGELVATTEDHCLVGSDWCGTIVRAFAAHPEAMAVTGPVLNGSPGRLMDWANFLHTFGAFLPPVDAAQRQRCPPPANVAFRRTVVPAGSIEPGWLELVLAPRLFRQGLFHVDESLVVAHVQSHGIWGTLRAHYDNGRTTTGLNPVPLSRRQLPWTLFRSTVRALAGKEAYRRQIQASLPLVFLLSCSHALGEVIGILAGPGQSPARLR